VPGIGLQAPSAQKPIPGEDPDGQVGIPDVDG